MKLFFFLTFLPLFSFAQAPNAEVLSRLEMDLKLNVGTERLAGKDCHLTIQYDRDELTMTVAQGEWGNRFASLTLPSSGMTRAFGDKVTNVTYKSTQSEKLLNLLYTRNSSGREQSDIELKFSTLKETRYSIKINDREVYCVLKN